MLSLKALLRSDIITEEELGSAVDTKELMYNKAKAFVLARHDATITQLKKGAHAGKYKTYIGTPRRSIMASTYDGLIEKLFKYYFDGETTSTNVTLKEGIKWEAEFRQKVKGTQRITIERAWDCINRSLPEELLEQPMNELDTEQICEAIRTRIAEKNLKMASVRTVLQWIHAAYRQGINKKLVDSDPIYGIKADYFAVMCSKNQKKKDFWDDNSGETLPPETIRKIEEHLWEYIDDVTARAILLNLYIGLRIGETPAILKSDIDENFVHIHRQQQRCPRNKETGSPQKFEIVEYTKNERGNSRGGRYIPLDLQPQIREFIDICFEKSDKDSEYLFSDKNGEPISKDSIRTYLRRHLEKLEIKTTKNHVFRKSLNSNVLIPNGYDAIERSMILGHSVRVNMENYTYQGNYKYREILDKASELVTQSNSKKSTQKIIQFNIEKCRKAYK